MVTHCSPAVLQLCRPDSHVLSIEDPAGEVGRVALLDNLLGWQVGVKLRQVVTRLSSSLTSSLANHENQETQFVRHCDW